MSQTIRTLIVDDERYNREELIFLLKSYNRIEIVGEADTGKPVSSKPLSCNQISFF